MKGLSFWDAVYYKNLGLGWLAKSAGIGAVTSGVGGVVGGMVGDLAPSDAERISHRNGTSAWKGWRLGV